MKDFSAFLDTRIGLIKLVSENIWVSEDLSCQFSQSTEYLICSFHPKLLSGSVEGQQLQQHMIESLQR